jgi:hypothetical protein
MSMPVLHVHPAFYASCTCCMHMIHTACPHCMSMLNVHHVCPNCMSILHANTACPGSISMLHVHAECPCCTSKLCPCCMSRLHTHAAFPCDMSMLHAHASCPRLYVACPCCMSMLRIHDMSTNVNIKMVKNMNICIKKNERKIKMNVRTYKFKLK